MIVRVSARLRIVCSNKFVNFVSLWFELYVEDKCVRTSFGAIGLFTYWEYFFCVCVLFIQYILNILSASKFLRVKVESAHGKDEQLVCFNTQFYFCESRNMHTFITLFYYYNVYF